VRSNFVGTEFTVYDKGDKAGKKNATQGQPRAELGAVTYQYNVLGTRGPRKMTVLIPQLDAQAVSTYKPKDESDGLLDRFAQLAAYFKHFVGTVVDHVHSRAHFTSKPFVGITSMKVNTWLLAVSASSPFGDSRYFVLSGSLPRHVPCNHSDVGWAFSKGLPGHMPKLLNSCP
jgi:Tub family